jgi:hypothetical protein
MLSLPSAFRRLSLALAASSVALLIGALPSGHADETASSQLPVPARIVPDRDATSHPIVLSPTPGNQLLNVQIPLRGEGKAPTHYMLNVIEGTDGLISALYYYQRGRERLPCAPDNGSVQNCEIPVETIRGKSATLESKMDQKVLTVELNKDFSSKDGGVITLRYPESIALPGATDATTVEGSVELRLSRKSDGSGWKLERDEGAGLTALDTLMMDVKWCSLFGMQIPCGIPAVHQALYAQ